MPSLREVAQWNEPAPAALAVAVVTQVFADVKPDAPDEQIGQATRLVVGRGYTAAELAYAASTLAVDPTLDRKVSFPNGQLTAADFERVIHELRSMRAKLTMKLDRDDVNRLIERHPDMLSIDDFGVCDYTAAETPLYRFSQHGKVKQLKPTPQLMEREDTGSERTGTGGTFSIAELVSKGGA